LEREHYLRLLKIESSVDRGDRVHTGGIAVTEKLGAALSFIPNITSTAKITPRKGHGLVLKGGEA
jgi:hypothetical protein